MEKLKLNEILRILNVEKRVSDNELYIHNVQDDIKKIASYTVVFHLNKDTEMNIKRFNKLKSCYIVTDQPILKTMDVDSEKFIYVKNVALAYKSFINYYRSLFDIPVIAVTGTCGKTTTKEMIAQVLSNKHKVVHTISSKNNLRFNNNYLMSFNYETEYGVFETAITHPGHLILGCDIYKPSIGIITTIGIDHLNWCKTHDNYIRTKGEMLTGLNNQGTLIINNDDDNIKKIDMNNYLGKIITFGIKNQSDYRAINIRYEEEGMSFEIYRKSKKHNVYVPGLGEHNVYNALATLAAVDQLGMNFDEAIYYLSKFKHIKAHVELKEGYNNSTIIDDTWSSNPTSLKAALKVLDEKGRGKTKIAVIGKISYLGKFANEQYKKIGKMVINHNIDYLITQDSESKKIGDYAIQYGLDKRKVINTNNNQEMLSILKEKLNKDTVVLFKCSMLDKSNQEVIKKITK